MLKSINNKITRCRLIQRIWKGFRYRKIIDFYKILPEELQGRICFYIRESYLIKKYHHTPLRNIISMKIIQLKNLLNNLEHYNEKQLITTDKINYVVRLVIKYRVILKETDTDAMYVFLSRACRLYSDDMFHFDESNWIVGCCLSNMELINNV